MKLNENDRQILVKDIQNFYKSIFPTMHPECEVAKNFIENIPNASDEALLAICEKIINYYTNTENQNIKILFSSEFFQTFKIISDCFKKEIDNK